jgi:hypothetical protein
MHPRLSRKVCAEWDSAPGSLFARWLWQNGKEKPLKPLLPIAHLASLYLPSLHLNSFQVIFSHLIGKLPSPNQSASKSLVLAHREELLLQAFRQIEASNPGLHIALEKGDLHADLDHADVVLASVPTIGRRQDSDLSSRLKRFDPALFKCIIIDEAHHTAAPSYRRVLEHFRAFEPNSHILVWGCSATLKRNDSLALADIFQEVTYHLDMADLMREGWLCRAELLQVYSDLDLDAVKFDPGAADFSLDDLSLALNTPQRNALVANTWSEFAIASKASISLLSLLAYLSRTRSQVHHRLCFQRRTRLRPGRSLRCPYPLK